MYVTVLPPLLESFLASIIRERQSRKLIITNRKVSAHLASKEAAKSHRGFDLRKSFYQSNATAIRVLVIFSGNVFNLEVKNYIYGRGKL